MRILVLHQFFLGANDPGGSRFNELTRLWAANGHEVTVLTGRIHHGTGRVDPRFKGRWVTEERTPEGVRVLWCYVPESYMRGYFGRFLGYVAFMLSSTLVAFSHVGAADVIVASSPPLTIGLNAWVVSAIKRIPFVFEIRDLWPEFAIEMGVLRNPALIRLAFALERFIYWRADRINVLTPAFRRHLIGKKGVPDDKIIHIPNGADLGLLRPGPRDNWVRKQYGWGDRFVAMYVGAHSKANYLWQLLDAAEALRDRPDILIVLVGDGNERPQLLAEVERRKLGNVQMIEAQPKKVIGEFINAADVGVAVLKKSDGFKTVYPNKVFDYMSCSRPILTCIDGEARRIVEEAEAGVFAEPEDAQAFRKALLKLLEDATGTAQAGANGHEFVKRNFSREALARRYESALLELCGLPRKEPAAGAAA